MNKNKGKLEFLRKKVATKRITEHKLTKYVVGAKANPPKNPSKAEKNGKVIPTNSVKTAKVCNPLNNPKIKNKLVKKNFVLQKIEIAVYCKNLKIVAENKFLTMSSSSSTIILISKQVCIKKRSDSALLTDIKRASDKSKKKGWREMKPLHQQSLQRIKHRHRIDLHIYEKGQQICKLLQLEETTES